MPLHAAGQPVRAGPERPQPASTLRHFRPEYLAHVHDRVCPAGVCPMDATDATDTGALEERRESTP